MGWTWGWYGICYRKISSNAPTLLNMFCLMICFLSNAAHLAVARTWQTYADGAFSSHPSFPRICGWHVNPCDVFSTIWKVSRNQEEFTNQLRKLFLWPASISPMVEMSALQWKCCDLQVSPRHPGHLYGHRRHGLSRCFPTAEDRRLAGLSQVPCGSKSLTQWP